MLSCLKRIVDTIKMSILMRCYTAAQDKLCPPSSFQDAGSGALVLRGKVGTTKFKNVSATLRMPFSDSVSNTIFKDIIHTRTTPVGDADYANLPIGSICLHHDLTAKALTDADIYMLKAGGWEKVETAGAIAIYGSDGVYKASYTTIDLACAALEDDDILKIKAGTYTLTSAISITAADVSIIGDGNVTIVGFAGADYLFKTVFGAISSTTGITFKGITFDHGDDATQMGIDIANLSATGRINLYLEDCSFESDGGISLYTLHAATAASIRWYVKRCDFEGPVNFTVGNTDDRVRLIDCDLVGGLVTGASATAMEILLERCKILHEGVTGGNNAQLMYAMYCLSETDANPNVYAALDTNDLAGSQNETVLFPTS